MKAILIVLVLVATLLVACAPETKTSEQTVILYAPADVNEDQTVVKYFEVRYIEPFQQAPVMVVNEGDTVELNFMLRDPTYYALDNYVEDYFDTGMVRFVADRKGEFLVRCVGDEDECPLSVVGYLVVQ